MSGKVAALLLAAGASRRMGTCKQLLDLGGKTVLARCIETLLAGGIEEIVVVTAPQAGEVQSAASAYPVRMVPNSQPGQDMAYSICTGRDALPASASGVLVALCDYPLLRPDTISQLAGTHGRLPGQIIIPCHYGRRGHPPLLPRQLLDHLQQDQPLRYLMRDHAEFVQHLELDDEGVLIDMDTPEDYQRILTKIIPPR